MLILVEQYYSVYLYYTIIYIYMCVCVCIYKYLKTNMDTYLFDSGTLNLAYSWRLELTCCHSSRWSLVNISNNKSLCLVVPPNVSQVVLVIACHKRICLSLNAILCVYIYIYIYEIYIYICMIYIYNYIYIYRTRSIGVIFQPARITLGVTKLYFRRQFFGMERYEKATNS